MGEQGVLKDRAQKLSSQDDPRSWSRRDYKKSLGILLDYLDGYTLERAIRRSPLRESQVRFFWNAYAHFVNDAFSISKQKSSHSS